MVGRTVQGKAGRRKRGWAAGRNAGQGMQTGQARKGMAIMAGQSRTGKVRARQGKAQLSSRQSGWWSK